MKRFFILAFTLLLSASLFAQTENASLVRVGDNMVVKADIQLTPCMLKGVKAFVLAPQISDGEHVALLPPIGMYSKDKFYPYLNAYGFSGKEGEMVYKKEQLPVTVSLNESIPYEVWMDGARLELVHQYDGCCGDSGIEAVDTLACYAEAPIDYAPTFRTLNPEKMKKVETVTGKAVIDFRVNKTTLEENYRNNEAELAKITSSIDKVKSAKEAEILSVVICGSASPEGKYSVNERLAAGRTQAIYDYVVDKYDFPTGVITSESIPENWAGLRKFVEETPLIKNKAAVLEIIDSDMDPDAKEAKLRTVGGWRVVHSDALPALRSTTYTITYKTTDYEATETKVDMANAAMDRGDYEKAAEHLAGADNSPEAEYARGTLAGLLKDWKNAAIHFKNALDGGLEEARAYYEEVSRHKYMRSK